MFEDNENNNGMENTETGDENDDKTENENDNEMDDNDNNDDDEINDGDDEINANDMEKNKDNSFDSKLINLEKILSGNLKKISAYDYLRYRAIHVFFKGWKFNNLNQKQASLYSAKIIYEKGSYKVYQIRKRARYWIEYNILPKSLQGCHQKIKSIIDDEDAIEQSLLFIHENKGKITPKKYQTFVKQILFPNLGL